MALALLGCGGGGESQPQVDAGQPDAAAPRVSVRILAFNDLHGALDPPSGSHATLYGPPTGGVSYLATHIAAARQANPNTIVVSVGDLFGASASLSRMFHDEPTVEAMALVGLDLAGLGNHEFDRGLSELRRMVSGGCHPDGCQDGAAYQGAPFSVVSTNVWDPARGQTLFAPYQVRSFDGVRVAFLATAPPGTPTIVGAADLGGLEFRDDVTAINATVTELRAQGIEAFVVLAHMGGSGGGGPDGCPAPSTELATFVTGPDPAVDVVLGGHSHEAYSCRMGALVATSAGSRGQLFSDLGLTVDRASGDVVQVTVANRLVTRDVAPDAAVDALLARYRDLATPILRGVVGRITASLTREPLPGGDSSLGSVVADGMLEATRGARAEVALIHQASLRSELSYLRDGSETEDGQITLLETMDVLPSGDSLVTLDLSGDELVATLEQQGFSVAGLEYTWDGALPVGARIELESVLIGGVPLVLSRVYRVTVNDYLLRFGDGYSAFMAGRHAEVGVGDAEAFASYLGAHSPVTPPPPRITRRK
ncbi:MAG: bifunctional metallophosphatase/5'-nucleotidase [Deltaproteobacteria bacterium]|nr:bifunctional metallophosphatase/5'-nucleotidase [Deltaproteobacteria bacterium]